MFPHLFEVIVSCFIAVVAAGETIPLLMPGVSPKQNETYLCAGFEVPRGTNYIVGFTPKATEHVAHHILVFGCSVPGYRQRDTPHAVWDCGEMTGGNSGFTRAPTCAEGTQIIYAWALEAPPLQLPKQVGFKTGDESGINFLVLQVHYADVTPFENGKKDRSGVILSMVTESSGLVKKRAGIYLLGTGGQMKARKETHLETACKIEKDITIVPFAYRTHTHKLGLAVSGWRLRKRPDTNEQDWTLLGKKNPQEPQMFYPVAKPLKIKRGDVLAARCTMYNFRDHMTFIGQTNNDEMCNFYLMYYVDGDDILDEKYCFSAGYPWYNWITDQRILNVPEWVDREASNL